MSNRLTIEGTTFVRYNGTTKGYCIYDDYGQAYNNTFEEDLPVPTGLELLELVLVSDDEAVVSMIDSAISNRKGIFIDGTYYDFDELKHLYSFDIEDDDEF